MKASFVLFFAIFAYGQAASIGAEEVTVRDLVLASADQEVNRIALVNATGSGMPWHEAQVTCIDQDYKGLLSIKSPEMQEAIEFAMVNFGLDSSADPWIGLHRVRTRDPWTWADGSALGNFSKWYSFPPAPVVGGIFLYSNQDHLGEWMYAGTTTWTSNYFFCEG